MESLHFSTLFLNIDESRQKSKNYQIDLQKKSGRFNHQN